MVKIIWTGFLEVAEDDLGAVPFVILPEVGPKSAPRADGLRPGKPVDADTRDG